MIEYDWNSCNGFSVAIPNGKMLHETPERECLLANEKIQDMSQNMSFH